MQLLLVSFNVTLKPFQYDFISPVCLYSFIN